MSLLRSLASWASALTLDSFGEDGIRRGKEGLIDTFGVMLGGGREESVQATRRAVLSAMGYTATVAEPNVGVLEFASGMQVDPVSGTWINGTAAHVLDFDDSAIGELIGHPSAVVLPAVWSSVRQSSVRAGEDLLLGYLIGLEAMMRLSAALGGGGSAYRSGFHTTTVLGVVAAAVGAGRARGLDQQALVRAAGIAASTASGLRASFGSPAKALQVGHAAASAVTAISLSEEGLGSTDSALDRPDGLASAYWRATTEPNRRIFEGVDVRFVVDPGIRIKRFASCRATHRTIDAALQLLGQGGIQAADIETVSCDPAPEARAILKYDRPQTSLEAKFSLEYCVAVSLLDGAAGPEQFQRKRLDAPDLSNMLERIQLVPSSEVPEWREPFRPDRLSITLKGGRELSCEVVLEPGHPQRPLSESELEDKFASCLGKRVATGPSGPRREVRRALDCLWSVEEMRRRQDLEQVIMPLLHPSYE